MRSADGSQTRAETFFLQIRIFAVSQFLKKRSITESRPQIKCLQKLEGKNSTERKLGLFVAKSGKFYVEVSILLFFRVYAMNNPSSWLGLGMVRTPSRQSHTIGQEGENL